MTQDVCDMTQCEMTQDDSPRLIESGLAESRQPATSASPVTLTSATCRAALAPSASCPPTSTSIVARSVCALRPCGRGHTTGLSAYLALPRARKCGRDNESRSKRRQPFALRTNFPGPGLRQHRPGDSTSTPPFNGAFLGSGSLLFGREVRGLRIAPAVCLRESGRAALGGWDGWLWEGWEPNNGGG